MTRNFLQPRSELAYFFSFSLARTPSRAWDSSSARSGVIAMRFCTGIMWCPVLGLVRTPGAKSSMILSPLSSLLVVRIRILVATMEEAFL